jgi:hypothetical protein
VRQCRRVIGESDNEGKCKRRGLLRLIPHRLTQDVFVYALASGLAVRDVYETSGIDRLSLAASKSPATLRALIPAQAPAVVLGKSLKLA